MRFWKRPAALLTGLMFATSASAIDSHWDGSFSNNFNISSNWTPFGVPGVNDDAIIIGSSGEIFLTGVSAINSLYLNSSELRTNGQIFDVDENLDIVANSTLTMEGSQVGADVLWVYVGELVMESGTVLVSDEMTINDTVRGYGTIHLTAASGTALFNTGGLILPEGSGMTIETTGAATVDLDGDAESGGYFGVVNVSSPGTNLTIDAPLSDDFDGTMFLADGNTIDFVQGWTLGSAGNFQIFGTVTAPTLAGSSTTLNGEIDVFGDAEFSAPIETDFFLDLRVEVGELELTGGTTYAGGTFYGTGEISQNSTATVAEPTTIGIPTFDFDGDNGLTAWLIASDLTLQVENIDEGTDSFNGTLRIDRGSLDVDVADDLWIMDGTLNFTSTFAGSQDGELHGDAVQISGTVDVNDEQHRIFADTTFTSAASVDVEVGAFLWMEGSTTYLGGTYIGNGSLKHPGDVSVPENVTLGVANVGFTGTVTIDSGATLSLIVDTLGAGDDVLNADFTLEGGGLFVNNPANFWTLGTGGSLTFLDAGATANEVFGDGINIAGHVEVTSGTANRLNAQTYFQASSTANIRSGARLRLLGDTTYQGGTITGAGELQQDGPATVSGSTVVEPGIFDMDGVAETTAWTINNAAVLTVDAGQLDDGGDRFDGSLTLATGALTVNNAAGQWRLSGPTTSTGLSFLSGSSRVVLEDTLTVNGGLLTVLAPSETSATTSLNVVAGALLNLAGATTYHGGSITGAGALIQGGNATVATNTSINTATYDWDGLLGPASSTTINPGAMLRLNAGLLDSDSGHDGLIDVANGARLEVNVVPEWGIRNGTLRLGGTNSVVQGSADLKVATAVGRIEGNGQILVDVDNSGTLSPGLSAGLIGINGNYTQQSTGKLLVELGGTIASAYDRLAVSGTASLLGTLDIDLIGGFVPGEGDVFRILDYGLHTTVFTTVLDSVFGAADGDFLVGIYQADHLSLYRPLPGDANFDGTVSGADFTIWADFFGAGIDWEEGDFTGDNQVTGADYTIWADNFGRSVTLDPAPADLAWLTDSTFAPQATTVPEPSAWMLMLIGVAGGMPMFFVKMFRSAGRIRLGGSLALPRTL